MTSRNAGFTTWTDLALETGLNVARSRHAVYLPAMEAEAERRRGRPSDGSKERATGCFPSLEAFYDARPERRTSGEADYGVHWHAGGKRWPEWRVSYVQATGEVIAVEQYGKCQVRVLGVVQPDPDKRFASKDEVGGIAWSDRHSRGTYYDTLDKILDGWADPDVSGFDLAWIERKLAEHTRGDGTDGREHAQAPA